MFTTETAELTKLVMACLVDKLGGEVVITQDEINQLSYQRLDATNEGSNMTLQIIKWEKKDS